jgi:uncharacterized protein (TIGR02594 family)
MRTLIGTKEAPGDADNKVILGMRDEIKRIWHDVPGLPAYADTYQHDATPWCGLAAGYCVSEAGYMPPYLPPPADDTDRWYWAQAFASDDNYIHIAEPRLGCIAVFVREGGGHVSFYERTEGSKYVCTGGNQSDAVTTAPFNISDCIALVWPKDAPLPPTPPADRPMLEEGDEGVEVVAVQTTLGLPPAACDGDFGPVTKGATKGYQAACGVEVDGIVGPDTWEQLDDLDARKAAGADCLPPEMIEAITQAAESSAIAKYSWKDRGKAPFGFTAGVACCFAYAMVMLSEDDPAAIAMAQADRGDPDEDALSWYRSKFQALGMSNSRDGVDTLRHLFVMILGLGMRESSGRYCEGRDMSASNVSADTAEAGAWQTSWNIRSCCDQIPPLLEEYWDDPNGLLTVFWKGVDPDSNDLPNYGSGDGAKYQFLSKYAPAFHCYVTALGMRYLRQHWGPINRSEVELREEADQMLQAVQAIVEEGDIPPEPAPEPELPLVTVTITPPRSARVVIVDGAE